MICCCGGKKSAAVFFYSKQLQRFKIPHKALVVLLHHRHFTSPWPNTQQHSAPIIWEWFYFHRLRGLRISRGCLIGGMIPETDVVLHAGAPETGLKQSFGDELTGSVSLKNIKALHISVLQTAVIYTFLSPGKHVIDVDQREHGEGSDEGARLDRDATPQ